MVTRNFLCTSSNTPCKQCDRTIPFGERMQADITGTGPWTNHRCFPSCSEAAQRAPSGESPTVRVPPKTVTFTVHALFKRAGPTECVECGKIFPIGDKMTAEVHDEVGPNKWRNKRCSPPCKGRTVHPGTRAASDDAAVGRNVTFAPARATIGMSCATCKRILSQSGGYLVSSGAVACRMCLVPHEPTSTSTPATPAKRQRLSTNGTTTQSTIMPPETPRYRDVRPLHVPIAPAVTLQLGPPVPIRINTTLLGALPITRSAALAAPQSLRCVNSMRLPAPSVELPPSIAAASRHPQPPPAPSRPQPQIRTAPASTAPGGQRQATPHAPTATPFFQPATTVPRDLAIAMPSSLGQRGTAGSAAASGGPRATTSSSTITSRSEGGVRSTGAATSTIVQRVDDDVQCVGELCIEEQIKRRIANAGVVNLADAEGWNDPVSNTSAANRRPGSSNAILLSSLRPATTVPRDGAAVAMLSCRGQGGTAREEQQRRKRKRSAEASGGPRATTSSSTISSRSEGGVRNTGAATSTIVQRVDDEVQRGGTAGSAAASGGPRATSSSSTITSRSEGRVRGTGAAASTIVQRMDDDAQCVGVLSIEEQIKRRIANACVVNLADAEGWNDPVSNTSAAVPRLPAENIRISAEVTAAVALEAVVDLSL